MPFSSTHSAESISSRQKMLHFNNLRQNCIETEKERAGEGEIQPESQRETNGATEILSGSLRLSLSGFAYKSIAWLTEALARLIKSFLRSSTLSWSDLWYMSDCLKLLKKSVLY